MVGHRSVWSGCCGSISCSNGTAWPTEALEDAIYDSQAISDFIGIDLAIESVPEATTLLRFRHLLEKHALTQRTYEEINASLAEQGLFMREGTIVDATIVAAAPSTKNKAKQRDREIKQTRKGNQWFFGMKAHIGVDALIGLTPSVVATSANVADVTMTAHLVREGDKRIYGDAGYLGMVKYLGVDQDPETRCCVAVRRCAIKKMEDIWNKTLLLAFEKTKDSIRAKVEHLFHVIKNLFGYRKVRFNKGLTKKQAQLFRLFALANLVLAGRCKKHAHWVSLS